MKSLQEIREQQCRELEKLITYVGGQSILAAQLDVSRQTVNQWVARGRISATMATKVHKMTNGTFDRKALRPDVPNWKEEV